MRIGLISTYGVKCGISTYSEHLIEALLKYPGNEIFVFAEENRGNSRDEFSSRVEFIRCFHRSVDDEKRILDALKEINPDILHIQHEYSIFRNFEMLQKIYELFRGRTVMTLHTINLEKEFDLKGFADHYVVHNGPSKEYLVRHGVSEENVHVIHHGTLIAPKMSKEEARKKLNLPLDRKILLSHAFFEKKKNIDLILQAVAELRDEFPLYYVHAGGVHPYGSPPEKHQLYYERCLKMVEELGLEDIVRFDARFIPDEELFIYLNSADIILVVEENKYPLLSASGTMHTVAERPVIGSDIMTFCEFPEGSFYRIEISVEALKKAIRELLTDEELGRSLVERMMEYARKTSWEEVAKEHLKLYRKVLGSEK
ncbi:MAG: glycosyltransferase [Archaeoglobi archaeon]|nr:glycosyltransferase [Candidatus Mnemosynella bozhongmuii]